MAIICSCRVSSDKKLDTFLDQNGQPVHLKDALNACSQTPGKSCEKMHNCIGQVAVRVNAHNSQFPDNAIQIYPIGKELPPSLG